MPPNVENTASLEAGLRSLVRYYLDCMLHSNAIFLCERLVACNPREENVLLLATCYFGESSELRAHALLQGCRLPESRFLLATCCLNLGRLAEVERVLLEGTGVLQKGPNGSREEILAEPCPIPFGAAGLRLLGLACQAAGRRESAEEYFRLSLELDPLMWVSIQSLCELGADFDVEKHFERFLEKAAGAAARSSAGGPVPAVETRGKRLPWSSYLQASSGGRADEDVVCGAAWWRGDDAAQAMPPPPPGARSSAASVSAGTMETPTRSRGGETKHMSPVGGGGLFGTPVPTQRRGASGANATTSHSQAFMTPAFRTPAASGVRFNAAGGGATPGGGIGGGRGRSGRGMSSSAAAVSRGKSCRRKGGGAPRGAAATRPATASSASSSAASDGIGHLLDLGARLGAFFPPAVGPGPVPGLEQLLQEASEAVSSAEEKEKERPAALTTAAAAATPSGDGIGTPIGKAEASGVGRRGGRGRIFATPGLTPIPTAWTPDHAGARDDDDVSVRDNDTAAQEETPSMFLAGLLRGTPETAGGAARRGGGRDGGSAFFSETPVPLVEGRLPEPVGMRAARMSAAEAVVGGGGGGLESSALRGEMASARAREAATSVREEAEAGASEGAGTASASVGVGVSGRVPRSAAAGGRRIGGRLSFSSAVGTDDASSTGSVAGGGGGGTGGGASVGEGGTEDRGRVPSRSQGRRRVATPGTTTPSASSHARHAATPAARSSMRPPPPAGGSGATPTSAALAGRVSRLSTSNRGAGGAEAAGSGRASRYAYPSITPMDVDEGAAERTPAAQNSRRPNTRAASKRTGNAAAVGGTRQTPVGTGTVGRVPVGSRWAVGKNNGGGGMNSNVSAGVSGDRGPGGAAADGRKEKEGDAAVKMTREQWQRAQYEETMAFAAVVIRRVSALGGEKEREKDKETERVVAALTILKAAAQASEAVRESTVVGAGAGAWAGDWAVARVFPHQEGGKREPGGGAGGGKSVIESGLRAVASLLVVLGKGYQHLMQFRCVEALEELKQLPPAQFCTGWVLHQVGKAYFERADYSNAKSALESMQRYDPHRLEGLDLLSTTLWHLKREVELSYLAQKVSEFDRHSPYTWCVVGNCFSLQKEHETALRFFQRAIQLDADMTYAYTLCGHEYVVNEDFDKAVACFRMAIRTDRRHYNAWYGLGSIYHRQEKYDMAEYHFRRALSINPQSSVLRVYLGMVLHANKRYVEALDMLGEASKTEPTNPQASFQRANVLMSMERYAEALHELEAVRNNVPKESAVYFLMGKVCKKLGKTDAAMRHFTIALDLHNKDKNLIKAAVDRLNEPDLDEEEKF